MLQAGARLSHEECWAKLVWMDRSHRSRRMTFLSLSSKDALLTLGGVEEKMPTSSGLVSLFSGQAEFPSEEDSQNLWKQ